MKQLKTTRRKTKAGFSLSILCMFLTCFSCAQSRSGYEVDIIYSPRRHIIPSEVTEEWKSNFKDSVILFFESGFNNDKIQIINGLNRIGDLVTSHETTGFAKLIPVGELKNTKVIELMINGGKVISINIDTANQYVAINFIDRKKIVIEILDDFAYYD